MQSLCERQAATQRRPLTLLRHIRALCAYRLGIVLDILLELPRGPHFAIRSFNVILAQRASSEVSVLEIGNLFPIDVPYSCCSAAQASKPTFCLSLIQKSVEALICMSCPSAHQSRRVLTQCAGMLSWSVAVADAAALRPCTARQAPTTSTAYALRASVAMPGSSPCMLFVAQQSTRPSPTGAPSARSGCLTRNLPPWATVHIDRFQSRPFLPCTVRLGRAGKLAVAVNCSNLSRMHLA